MRTVEETSCSIVGQGTTGFSSGISVPGVVLNYVTLKLRPPDRAFFDFLIRFYAFTIKIKILNIKKFFQTLIQI